MAFRVDVNEEGVIGIMRPLPNGQVHNTEHRGLETALLVIKKLLKEDLEEAEKERFVPQLIREARKAYQKLEEECPHGKDNKT